MIVKWGESWGIDDKDIRDTPYYPSIIGAIQFTIVNRRGKGGISSVPTHKVPSHPFTFRFSHNVRLFDGLEGAHTLEMRLCVFNLSLQHSI